MARLKRYFEKSHPVARLLGQLVVLAACGIYAWYLYASSILPTKIIRDTFQETNCLVTSKRLSTKHHFFSSYRADLLVSYNAGGVEYTRWVSGKGIDQSFHRNSSYEKEMLANFEIGETYPCWYDPNNPQSVALVLHDFPLYSFAIPAIIALFVLYNLRTYIKVRSRNKRRKK